MIVNRNLKLYLNSSGLIALSVGLVFLGVYFDHGDKFRLLVILALATVVGAIGLGLDLWRRTTPGASESLFITQKRVHLTAALFVTSALALAFFVIRDSFLAAKPHSERQWSPVFILSWLVGYNLLVLLVRTLRARKVKAVKT